MPCYTTVSSVVSGERQLLGRNCALLTLYSIPRVP